MRDCRGSKLVARRNPDRLWYQQDPHRPSSRLLGGQPQWNRAHPSKGAVLHASLGAQFRTHCLYRGRNRTRTHHAHEPGRHRNGGPGAPLWGRHLGPCTVVVPGRQPDRVHQQAGCRAGRSQPDLHHACGRDGTSTSTHSLAAAGNRSANLGPGRSLIPEACPQRILYAGPAGREIGLGCLATGSGCCPPTRTRRFRPYLGTCGWTCRENSGTSWKGILSFGRTDSGVVEYDPVKDSEARAARNRPHPDSDLAKLARR
jgi:hypothetical protein